MALPLFLMAAGTALQVYGQYKANMDQAEAEIQNSIYYEKQAQFALQSQFRQEDLAKREYEFRKGAQVSAYGKGNVDISGSAAGVVAETLAQKVEELNAIKQKGTMEFTLARSRSQQSQKQADTLRSFEYNALQAGGTILGNASRATDNNPNSKVGKFLLGGS
jgi:hypothetical protein